MSNTLVEDSTVVWPRQHVQLLHRSVYRRIASAVVWAGQVWAILGLGTAICTIACPSQRCRRRAASPGYQVWAVGCWCESPIAGSWLRLHRNQSRALGLESKAPAPPLPPSCFNRRAPARFPPVRCTICIPALHCHTWDLLPHARHQGPLQRPVRARSGVRGPNNADREDLHHSPEKQGNKSAPLAYRTPGEQRCSR